MDEEEENLSHRDGMGLTPILQGLVLGLRT